MQKVTIKIAAILVVTSLFYSCGGNQEEITEEEIITEEITTEEATDEMDYVLPSPLQIAELFKNAGFFQIV